MVKFLKYFLLFALVLIVPNLVIWGLLEGLYKLYLFMGYGVNSALNAAMLTGLGVIVVFVSGIFAWMES